MFKFLSFIKAVVKVITIVLQVLKVIETVFGTKDETAGNTEEPSTASA